MDIFLNRGLNDLVRVMANAIDKYACDYSKLKALMAEHTEQYYSFGRIASLYVKMFDDVLSK